MFAFPPLILPLMLGAIGAAAVGVYAHHLYSKEAKQQAGKEFDSLEEGNKREKSEGKDRGKDM